jgi:hypothetical protein
LLIIAMAAATASASGAPNWPATTIESFVNPDGAKRWTAKCEALAADAPQRINVPSGQITLARRSDEGCVYFEANGQQYWVKEGAVTLSETKGTTKNACKVYAQAGGSTVEAATMGAGTKGTRATCQ